MLDAPSTSWAFDSSISASRSLIAASIALRASDRARISSPVEVVTDAIARPASRSVAMVMSDPPGMLQTYQNTCSMNSAFPQVSKRFLDFKAASCAAPSDPAVRMAP